MTETKHKKNRTWTDTEKETHKEEYGTEILIENGTIDECNTRNAPTDASIVHYVNNDRAVSYTHLTLPTIYSV